MTSISLFNGWKIFLTSPKFPSLQRAAEEMYRLNVFARHVRHHPLTDQIYTLKDNLIEYLYKHGYAVDVKLHQQKRMCLTCDGTGEYWTGEECRRCDGTGIYSLTMLYAFRFVIEGRSYCWHQLQKLVDYEVTLTNDEPGVYREPLGSEAILDLEQAWAGCCLVWWALFWRGVRTEILLFPSTRAMIAYKFKRVFRKDEVPF